MVMRIEWCGESRQAQELAQFFVQHVEPAYISHSELQGPRAVAPDQWSEHLLESLCNEIEPRLTETRGSPSATSQPVLAARQDDTLVALSLVTFNASVPVPFGIIEDLVVHSTRRNQGIGRAVVDWIINEAVARNIRRLFLESGVHNGRAHHFFEEVGFEVCSVVMMRSL